MTDKEQLEEMFERAGINADQLVGPKGNTGLQVFVPPRRQQTAVTGNPDFSTSFHFDSEGKLLGVGVWSS